MKIPKLHTNFVLPQGSLAHNFSAINGSDAEKLAASNLITACSAEVKWGSRNEDNRKVDLFLSFDHPWIGKELLIVLSQIKSRNSYGKISGNAFTLKRKAISKSIRTSHAICLIWVDQKTGKNYWAYIHPNSKVLTKKFGSNHEVSPCLKYDLARCISKTTSNPKINYGIIIKNISPDNSINIKELRKRIRTTYRSIESVKSPILGDIQFTRLGWRHMFRKSRKGIYKHNSIEIIPYLKRLLEKHPTQHWVSNTNTYKQKNYEFRTTTYILSFNNIKLSKNKRECKINVKLIEEIGYPIDWKSETLLSQKIVRRVVFQSCNYKIT